MSTLLSSKPSNRFGPSLARSTVPTPPPTQDVAAGNGYVTGDPFAIANRYSPGVAPYAPSAPGTPPPPRMPAPNTTTPAAPADDLSAPADSAIFTAPTASMPSGTQPAGSVAPQGNAAQRWADWKETGGSKHTFNRARAAQGIRPAIDARAPLAAGSERTDFAKTFGAKTTWAQRQAENAAAVREIADRESERLY